jgi:hypothetical protein
VNPEVKTKWLAALRSGEFEQGAVRLKTEVRDGTSKFCCLGVLCELHDKEHGCEQSYESISGELPDHVRDWAGLSENNPYMNQPVSFAYPKEWRTHISVLNDIKQFSFNQLADLIEAQL